MKALRGVWVAAFAAAVGLHVVVVAIAIGWAPGDRPAVPLPAAMLIELAPLPAAPTPVPSEMPPAPQQTVAAPPPEPEPIPEPPPELPKLDLPLPPQVIEEAVPPPPPPRPRPRPPAPVIKREMPTEPMPEQRLAETAPAQQTASAPPAAPQQAPFAAAPRQDQPNVLPPSDALPTWRGALLGHLERSKRYPQAAQWRRQQGTVYLRFAMDRAGKVLRATIERSSGFDALDEEVLALIARAQPLPAPPDEMPGDAIELIVPFQFHLR